MLDLLESSLGDGVLGVTLTAPHASDAFLHFHSIAKAIKERRKVLFVTSRFAEINLRIIFSKLAIRWDPTLLRILEVGGCLRDELGNGDSDVDRLCTSIEEASSDCSVIILEDGSAFDVLTTDAKKRLTLLTLVHRLAAREDVVRIWLSFGNDSMLYRLATREADFSLTIENVGAGFGKDATGAISIRRKQSGAIVDEVTRLLYLVGDRTIKCFQPGNAATVYF